jgi:hypothetical protein
MAAKTQDTQTLSAAPARRSAAWWIALVAQVIASAMMLLGGVMNLLQIRPFIESPLALGMPLQNVSIVGAAALISMALYLFPRTAFLGAILISAYFGGAIALHLRAEDAVVNFIRALAVCGLLWLPVYLRNPELRRLLPFKRAA